ncbi:type II toxin-antitoxin system HicB family antitoxin [Weissella paramesenteroides]|uniref:type II toxin-antitoxin system HicB family antitoxin n=1 Tax=Weissella paramesenteroides TaxID=1249 RepID=UPI00207334C5|nr:type II toxin-antitoxin system HicB family antitoxin [Weissella paramesenteroides]MCM6765244.1 type II toxin-antitoxin system HicB family antitoxin [Weissella paramesenteroides]MCM6766615.1 type II toxin-antitoxin system HicB family antitoxin [Weissella paramesenteroides]MCM6771655.1 type II toxin-antitoxin system HicB family antitoxin [Weissella paramesenteroides]MCM6779252.1 type II toxin-antitoxin system HicB family antitoxin [Weissella paramesenteroides]MCM6782173.1 type II toxin-antito
MTNNKRLIYPVIISEFNDDGHYFVVTSPNIKGMVTQGDTAEEAIYWAEDAIATMLNGSEYPAPQDPSNWEIKDNERIVYVSVDMTAWLKANSKTIRKTITVPEYLSDLAKDNGINVSAVATRALEDALHV